MLCNVCKQNEAKVHYSQLVGDKMQKIDLCEACSKEKGVTDPTTFSLAEMLFGTPEAKETEETVETASDVRCPACGFSQTDLKKTARMGCPECYTTFGEPLSRLLKSMHRGTRHVGKAPRKLAAVRDTSLRLKHLQDELDKAVASENFERAAVLRDEIKGLKSQSKDAPAS